jgi:nitric oxide reductase large subunit
VLILTHYQKFEATSFDVNLDWETNCRLSLTEVMQTLRWLRVPGDTIFVLGAIALVWFVAGLKTGHSLQSEATDVSLARNPEPVS